MGDNTRRTIWTQVSGSSWASVACGHNFTLAIQNDGTLWGTGDNDKGQLGLGDNTNRNSFIQVGSDTNWQQASGGSNHSLVIKTDNTLWASGWNNRGQLGMGNDGAGTDRNTFGQVGSDSWEYVVCGMTHTMALKIVAGTSTAPDSVDPVWTMP